VYFICVTTVTCLLHSFCTFILKGREKLKQRWIITPS
jgi:hypothetical protein